MLPPTTGFAGGLRAQPINKGTWEVAANRMGADRRHSIGRFSTNAGPPHFRTPKSPAEATTTIAGTGRCCRFSNRRSGRILKILTSSCPPTITPTSAWTLRCWKSPVLANRRGHTNLSKTLGRIETDGFSGAPFGLSSEITRQIEATYLSGNINLARKLGRPDIDELAKPGWQSQGMDFTGQVPRERLVQLLRYFATKVAENRPTIRRHAATDVSRFEPLAALESHGTGDLSFLASLALADPQFRIEKTMQVSEKTTAIRPSRFQSTWRWICSHLARPSPTLPSMGPNEGKQIPRSACQRRCDHDVRGRRWP